MSPRSLLGTWCPRSPVCSTALKVVEPLGSGVYLMEVGPQANSVCVLVHHHVMSLHETHALSQELYLFPTMMGLGHELRSSGRTGTTDTHTHT